MLMQVQETEWFSNEYLDHQKTRYKDVVCATSAAPTFFSDYSFNGLNYVDGGVTTNNPSFSILTHARLQQGRDMRKTILVSVGTGIAAQENFDTQQGNQLLYWASNFSSVSMNNQMREADQLCREELGDNYYRFDPILYQNIAMDATSKPDIEM